MSEPPEAKAALRRLSRFALYVLVAAIVIAGWRRSLRCRA